MYSGILLINKPIGMTSHDVVARLRRITGQRRIGHTGTLDPMAEGLLVVCLGNATSVVQFLSDEGKSYEAEITLGIRSKTYDAEGVDEKSVRQNVPALTGKEITDLLSRFSGKIRQTVPPFSAVKIQGKRLYELARKDEEINELPTREVEISKIQLHSYESSKLRIAVTCSKGTYIRSLAHDIGEAIGCGAFLSALKRTTVGSHRLEDALSLEQVEQLQGTAELEERLIPHESALSFTSLYISDQFSMGVEHGRALHGNDVLETERPFVIGERVTLKDRAGKIRAVGEAMIDSAQLAQAQDQRVFRYLRVLK